MNVVYQTKHFEKDLSTSQLSSGIFFAARQSFAFHVETFPFCIQIATSYAETYFLEIVKIKVQTNKKLLPSFFVKKVS